MFVVLDESLADAKNKYFSKILQSHRSRTVEHRDILADRLWSLHLIYLHSFWALLRMLMPLVLYLAFFKHTLSEPNVFCSMTFIAFWNIENKKKVLQNSNFCVLRIFSLLTCVQFWIHHNSSVGFVFMNALKQIWVMLLGLSSLTNI